MVFKSILRIQGVYGAASHHSDVSRRSYNHPQRSLPDAELIPLSPSSQMASRGPTFPRDLFHMMFSYSLTATFYKFSPSASRKPSGHRQAWRFHFELRLLEGGVMLSSSPYLQDQCLIVQNMCWLNCFSEVYVRFLLFQLSPPVSPKKDDHNDKAVWGTHVDMKMQKGLGVFGVWERKLRYTSTVVNTIVIFKYLMGWPIQQGTLVLCSSRKQN